MRTSIVCLLLAALPALAKPTFSFHIASDDAGSWTAILTSVGFVPDAGESNFIVFPAGSDPDAAQWMPRLEQGAHLILEGDSPLARALGFRPGQQRTPVRSLVDVHNPRVPVVWERSLDLPVWQTPEGATVYASERWKGYPLVAGLKRGSGAVLWLAVSPGKEGYERFPYIPQALMDLGVEPPLRSARLWAFFDSSYRTRVDVEWIARRWRKSGIAALHVAAWHYWEPDAARDKYLNELIAACHRNAIQVYAWVELPHVSEKFWQDHPQWREKTAIGQDAHLDWRKLMNLANRDCFRAASDGVDALLKRFDWDGVNLAELYFESLEGAANPARFTPMNDDIRAEFKKTAGFDPLDLFAAGANNPKGLRQFLEYRAGLAHRMQEEWIKELDKTRRARPQLDVVLTHVDDRFDTTMRDKIGADVAALLPTTEAREITFLIEDPATVWDMGPQRYPEIRKRYETIAKKPDRLAIDINIVERYQDVYPTKQQTGVELFQLVHLAAGAFARVALYFEQSIMAPDLALLPAAAASVNRLVQSGDKLVIVSENGVGVKWDGAAQVNGKAWPVAGDGIVWLPRGAMAVEPAKEQPAVRILDYNADLQTASALESGVEISYSSKSRAYFLLNAAPYAVELDGGPWQAEAQKVGERYLLTLPRGQHLVTIQATAKGPELLRSGTE
ncbi:MAG: hypothetical protein ABI693_11145 [Bryobacteraceae bacterium]